MPKLHTQNQQQNLPPLKGGNKGPISDPIFLQAKEKKLAQQPAKTNLHDAYGEDNTKDGGTGNDDPLLEVDFESGQEDNAQGKKPSTSITKLPDGRPAASNNQAVEAHVDHIFDQNDLDQDGHIEVGLAQGLLSNFSREVMNLDNEQRLLNIIDEAEFSQNGLMNK